MSEQSNLKLERIPMSEQAKLGILFQMELIYTVSESLTELDNMLNHLEFKQYRNSKPKISKPPVSPLTVRACPE